MSKRKCPGSGKSAGTSYVDWGTQKGCVLVCPFCERLALVVRSSIRVPINWRFGNHFVPAEQAEGRQP